MNNELESKLNRNTIEIDKLVSIINNTSVNKDNHKRLKNIELEIDNISSIHNNLNIYINLFIDKIIVKKLLTRYKMNLDVYFNDGSIRNIYYEK